MSIGNSVRVTIVSAIGFAALSLPGLAAPPTTVDLAGETVGAEPKAFVPVVGFWRIEDDNGKKVLVVDGRQWKEGQSSAGIADKARALYGERYAEFLDRVQAYAYFPYVVAPNIPNFTDGEISIRFEGLSGRVDQGDPVQSQAERRLPDDPRELSGEQSRALEVRERQALFGQVGAKHADRDASVARPQGSHQRAQGSGLSGWQALSGAHACPAGVGTHRPVVESGQPHVFLRLHGHDKQLKADRGSKSRRP